MERILEVLVRHGEKVLFALVAAAAVGLVAGSAIPDRRISDLRSRDELAGASIESVVSEARAQAGNESLAAPRLAGRVARDYRPLLPDGDFGPTAGVAFYLPPPVDVGEEREVPAARVEPPAVPQAFRVLGKDPRRVELAWDAVPGASGYVVRRRDASGAKTWTLSAPGLVDDSVVERTRYEYTVAAVRTDGPDGNLESRPAPPVEAMAPEAVTVAFGGWQEGTAIGTFVVRRFHEGVWYEKTFYLVEVGSRIGQVLDEGGLPRPVLARAADGGTRMLDLTSPYVLAGVESFLVPVFFSRNEYLIRFGPAESDVAWATSLPEFRGSNPDKAASARLEIGPDGKYIVRVGQFSSGVTDRRYRALLRDVREADATARVVLEQERR